MLKITPVLSLLVVNAAGSIPLQVGEEDAPSVVTRSGSGAGSVVVVGGGGGAVVVVAGGGGAAVVVVVAAAGSGTVVAGAGATAWRLELLRRGALLPEGPFARAKPGPGDADRSRVAPIVPVANRPPRAPATTSNATHTRRGRGWVDNTFPAFVEVSPLKGRREGAAVGPGPPGTGARCPHSPQNAAPSPNAFPQKLQSAIQVPHPLGLQLLEVFPIEAAGCVQRGHDDDNHLRPALCRQSFSSPPVRTGASTQ